MKLAYGDTKELIPTNFEKDGMKDLMDKRRKGKATIFTNSLVSTLFNVNADVFGL